MRDTLAKCFKAKMFFWLGAKKNLTDFWRALEAVRKNWFWTSVVRKTLFRTCRGTKKSCFSTYWDEIVISYRGRCFSTRPPPRASKKKPSSGARAVFFWLARGGGRVEKQRPRSEVSFSSRRWKNTTFSCCGRYGKVFFVPLTSKINFFVTTHSIFTVWRHRGDDGEMNKSSTTLSSSK